jgi:iron complex transport system substrate-binding protein
LGLGNNLIGVTHYCKFPPEAQAITKIGALMDTNYEAILTAKPTLILFPSEHKTMAEFAGRFGISDLAMDHRSIKGIIDSVDQLGKLCGREVQATALTTGWKDEIEQAKLKYSKKTKQAVLVAVARESLDIATSAVYVSGRDGFYNELLSYVGARNVFDGSTIAAATMSPEAFLSLKPDVIVEMAPESFARGWSENEILASWRKLPGLEGIQVGSSVSKPRLAVIKDDYADIPGPRFIQLLRSLEEILHG